MNFIEAVLEANRRIIHLIDSRKDGRLFEYYALDEALKGAGGDRSLVIDIEAEKIFIDLLSSFGRINSEECGEVGSGANEVIIDPIDGSSNVVSLFPYFGSSISLKVNQQTVVAVVTNLATREVFVRDSAGYREFRLDNTSITKLIPFEHAKIGLFEKAYSNPNVVDAFFQNGIKFRSPGAVALSLAYARRVNFVVFIGAHRIYDIDAGIYLNDDLFIHNTQELLLVSKEKQTFDKIKSIIEKSGVKI